eukprot:TRINITY_DN12267_c0_g1_i1.p1 TRINITY_DN12267_c0_g1~~TRINITY_DN12267_c0_g1_i1.p1  ORF type:complete len:169 (-),score=10.17 TRINITY_DN12267_c0_g1_i1:56-562(-)
MCIRDSFTPESALFRNFQTSAIWWRQHKSVASVLCASCEVSAIIQAVGARHRMGAAELHELQAGGLAASLQQRVGSLAGTINPGASLFALVLAVGALGLDLWLLTDLGVVVVLALALLGEEGLVSGGFDRVEHRASWMFPVLCVDTTCLLYTSPSPRDRTRSRMPSSA